MRWEGRRQSGNVEDRRGKVIPVVGGGLGLLVLVGVTLLLGGDPTELLNSLGGGSSVQVQQGQPNPEADRLVQFVSVVLADTEDVWTEQFKRLGRTYEEPKLVVFSGQVQSACGSASAAVGPFYCPGDRNVYIDLSFYGQLKQRFGAPGDFAQAYVIAHEIGHHVQNLLGISDKVEASRRTNNPEEYNRLSVRLELQADFLAGVWAHHTQQTKHVLEQGDLEEALRAASAIGDDNIQRQAQGYVVPDSFTHGTSAQRVRWFRKGFQTGNVADGDTFAVPDDRL